jgi:UDP-N-acetylglucosamine--N-acetylmuramyl-(pentapeptide) pyrophosphoryl-undecaprenol N-acetylglucosamine transferase
VPDAECTAARLEAEVGALLADTDRLAAMGTAARQMGHPDAAARVAELVDAHAG